ncbi:MAG: hypothetical protein AB9919_07760 [Geobacteraceae bacterium]
MKILSIIIAALFALTVPVISFAVTNHADHGGHSDIAHQEVTEGVKATFKVMSMKEHLKTINIKMPKGMKETHHLAVEFKEVKSGRALTEGEVKVKVQNPDKSSQTKNLIGMQGHFGADFDLSKKGKYGVLCKFLLKDGKVRTAKFWYTVK